MKTIFFGKKFIAGLVSEVEERDGQFPLVYIGASKPAYGKYVAGGPTGHFTFEILSASDEQLISFAVPKYDKVQFKSGFNFGFSESGLVITIGLSDASTVALNTGVASKFRYINSLGEVVASGTVGVPNSGCDLLIGDCTISSGTKYKSFGFKILIPHKMFIV